MIYGSVCSGIEAATVAWHSLGWKPAFFSEIEKFPREVLSHHYPEVPLHGDFTTIGVNDYGSIDLLVGGTPCQSFSIAGLRKGLDDDRGNLALEFLKLAQRKRPTWLVWENVPGVLSSNGGRDFGSFLGGLVECGYGFAYRVLDAYGFGIPQQRRRVFVIGHSSGDWRYSAAALFERQSFARDKKTSGAKSAHPTLQTTCHEYSRADGFTAIHTEKGLRRITPIEAERLMGFPDDYTKIQQRRQKKTQPENKVRNNRNRIPGDARKTKSCVCNMWKSNEPPCSGSLPPNKESAWDSLPSVQYSTSCCRGHGLGDACMGISGGEWVTPDGPRYKALGNSMAVPVMHWIGQRIQQVEDIL